MKPAIGKVLKWLNWTLLLPVLFVILLLAVLLYTPAGLKLSVWLGQKYVPQLSVASHSGSLLGGMQLNNIRWQNETVKLQFEQAKLDINNRCLFQLKLCISALSVNDGNIIVAGNTVSFSRFSTSAEVWGRQVQLNNSQLQQLQISLATGDEQPAEPFKYQAPELSDITLPLTVYVNGFQLTNASLIQAEQVTALPDLNFSLQAREHTVRLLDLQANHPQVSLSTTANITLQGDYPLSARLSAVLKQAPLAEQQLNINLSGSLADLAVSARAVGTISGSAEAELALLAADLPLSLNLQYDAFSWPPANPDAWQVRQGEMTASGDLQQLNFTLATGLSHSTIPDTELSAKGHYQLNDSVLTLDNIALATLDGTVNGSARVELVPALSWQAELNLNAIKPGTFWPAFDGELSAEINGKLANQGTLDADGSWQTELSQLAIKGNLRDETVTISGDMTARFQQDTGNYRFSTGQLLMSHGANQITLTGSLAQQWQLDATVDIADLSSSLPLAAGVINAELAIRGPQRQPQVTASVTGNDLRYGSERLQQLSLELQLRQAAQLEADLTLNISNGVIRGYQLEQLTITGAGNEAQHNLELNLQSPLSDTSLQLTGQLTDRNLWQGQLIEAEIGSPVGVWQLQQAVKIAYLHREQQLDISQHCWLQAPGSVCLTEDARLSAERLAATIALRQLDLASLNAFMPLAVNLSGELNADANASWQSGQRPQFNLSATSSSGALTEQNSPPITLQWQQLTLDSELKDDQLAANLRVTLNEQAQLTAKLGVADVSSSNRPLTGRLQLTDFTLAFLQPLLDEYSELAGVVSADIRAEGSIESPMLAGQLALQKLRVKGNLAPADINEGNLRLEFNGEQAELQGDIITPQGNLALTGKANWQQLDKWQAQLAVKGDALSLQIEQGKLQVKPDLEINASPQLTKITGKIDIPSALFSIDELPQGAIGLSDDTVVLNPERQPVTAQQAMAIPLEADIRVQLGEKVKLEAFGLETLLRGNLQVRQKQNKQTVNGEVRLIDGTFRSYGQDLLIRQGKMTFSGPPDQPYLNVEAIRNPANMEDNVIAGIRVTGPADRPQINIFSEPAMPQANALSYLLVGRDLDSESGSAANAVTTSLIGMSIASSGSLVGDIGEAFGVSDLTLDTAGSGDSSQVTVSGYLNRDLQIKYGIGIFEPIGEFTLRYRLMQSLYLEAVSGLDNAVDLLYRFEFD
tara:strand:- start:3690 stop:7322 length:3633 start_codon:yes stop_codon:yes gene_type:complete